MNNSKVLGELQETFEQVFGDGVPLLTHEETRSFSSVRSFIEFLEKNVD